MDGFYRNPQNNHAKQFSQYLTFIKPTSHRKEGGQLVLTRLETLVVSDAIVRRCSCLFLTLLGLRVCIHSVVPKVGVLTAMWVVKIQV